MYNDGTERRFSPASTFYYAYRLRFPDDVEREFLKDYYKNSLIVCRVAIALGIIFYAGFGLLDIWAMPISKGNVWFIRFFIVCPEMGIVLLCTFFNFFERWIQVILSFLLVFGGFGIIGMILVAQKQELGYTTYYAGLTLVLLWGFTFIRLRFLYALSFSLMILIAYEIVAIYFQNLLFSSEGIIIFINNNFFLIATMIVGMICCYFIEVYNRRDFLQRMIINIEQQKSEKLLLNILPKEIAKLLKEQHQIIADQFDNVSILFADIGNFTPLSEKLEPDVLVQLLNEVFSHLDSLTEKYGLEKIKTIGDCYMVASGIPCPRTDHAYTLVCLALEMRMYLSSYQFQDVHQLSLRMGIHSGSVVAGVIGVKKLVYDLWGDTVNTASRMESHGQDGKIQITEATFELVKDYFICESQGEIRVKGKGEMKVWHVVKKKD